MKIQSHYSREKVSETKKWPISTDKKVEKSEKWQQQQKKSAITMLQLHFMWFATEAAKQTDIKMKEIQYNIIRQ